MRWKRSAGGPMGSMLCKRGTPRGTVRIQITAISCNHRHARECAEPRGNRVGRAFGKQINGSVPYEVAQDRTVASPFLPCPVIHTDNLWLSGNGERSRAHESRQRVVARGHAEMVSETRTRFAAECHTDLGEGDKEAVAPART